MHFVIILQFVPSRETSERARAHTARTLKTREKYPRDRVKEPIYIKYIRRDILYNS